MMVGKRSSFFLPTWASPILLTLQPNDMYVIHRHILEKKSVYLQPIITSLLIIYLNEETK